MACQGDGAAKIMGQIDRRIAVRASLGAAIALVAAAGWISAGEVTLKNGLILSGNPRRIQALTIERLRPNANAPLSLPFVMIDNGYQRIFVPKNQAARIDDRDDLSKYETFKLPQHKTGGRQITGRVLSTGPFNAFGQRVHTIRTSQKEEEQIVVGITKIGPKYLSLTGLRYQWNYGIATSSVPAEQLDPIIRKVTDRKNPDHRFGIARFYLQAGLYEESGKELESIAKDFPELSSRVSDARKELQEFEHTLILQELRRRKAAGQHEMAHSYALGVPLDKASGSVVHDVRDLLTAYDTSRERISKAKILLGELQAKLEKPDMVAAVMPLRPVLDDQLTMESIDRLGAFFNLVDDKTLQPEEKLALAYSGAVVGSASAVTDLRLAVRLWEAQHAILEYLHTDSPQERRDRQAQLDGIDGITPELVVKLIRNLPPTVETPDIRTGVASTIQTSSRGAEPGPSYGVLLPPEYDWHHQYPMIVALHPAEHPGAAELDFWGGTLSKPGRAQAAGYIVIAPEYVEPNAHDYGYSMTSHDAVLRSIVDARRRFNIDSDRIFLTGHGMGGDAAFDIGMSHPDLFAGVIPFNGIAANYCKWYWTNAGHTSWYVVVGEFDARSPFTANALTMTQMMKASKGNSAGMDVVLVEYAQRGYEPYFEETPRIFEWMEPLRRQKAPRDFEMHVLRPSESRFYWLQAGNLPQSVMESNVLAGHGSVTPMRLAGRISPGNTIRIFSPAKSHTIWLSPDLASFEKRATINVKGVDKYHKVPKSSIRDILDDYSSRADRQLIYTAKIDVN
jgi:pimeloyl-ACP methyl ester carboxylesterase